MIKRGMDVLRLRIGLVGTGQHSFPGDKEGRFRRSAAGLQELARKLDFDLYVIQDTLISEEDAERAVKEAEANQIDFLLIQNTSFSAGFLAPVLARIKNAHIGLWAIPEEARDGAVPFNSFCCVNMYASIIGHYLREYGIPFKWFYGDTGHELFARRFEITVKALTALKNLCHAKVALIGGIAPGFNDLYFDERKLERVFPGLKINRLHEYSEIKDRALGYRSESLEPVIQEMVDEAGGIHPESESLLETNARMYRAYRDFCSEYGYEALAVSCWRK